jgi:hypothetical protein
VLQTIEEIKAAEIEVGQVINGVDNPGLLSVDSTTPIQTKVEVKDPPAEEVKEVKKEPSEEKPEKKVEGEPEKAALKEEQEPVVKTSIEKRIGDLTKKWRTTERERDFEKGKRLALEEENRKLKAQVPITTKPVRSDFEDDEAYIEALTDWRVDEKLRVHGNDEAVRTADVQEQERMAVVSQAISDVTDKGREKYEDFDELVYNEELALTSAVLEIVVLSEIAEDVLYYLGQHPEESATISGLSALKAAREIGKIENLISTKPVEPVKEEVPPKNVLSGKEENQVLPKKLTNAPEPIKPVQSNGVSEKDPNNMSPAEYRAWRNRKKD